MIDDLDTMSLEWLRSKPGIKWARAREGELAAWVADMDYPIPQVVSRAISDVLASGDLGYPDLRDGPRLARPFVDRMSARHGLALSPDRVREFDDVLNAIQAVLHVSVPSGGRVAIHTPTYPPFLDTITTMGYVMEPIPYRRHSGRWEFDVEAASVTVARSHALILVNPHNPTGRVLAVDELRPLVTAAQATGTLLIADEVHADLVYSPHRHVALAGLEPQSVTVTSATKAFNLAGIRCAVAHIGSDDVWERLQSRPHHLFGAVSNVSVAATAAAWSREGDAWLDNVRGILERNRRRVTDRMPAPLEVIEPEATYLAWIDTCSALGDDPADEIRKRTGVILTSGNDFGPEGHGFVRLNFATSGDIVDEILDRISQSFGRG